MRNNATIKAGGIAPGRARPTARTWTSQLFVLGDYHNVAASGAGLRGPSTPPKKAKYANTPAALAGLPAHPGGQGRRLLQQGFCLGQADRRGEGHGHRNRCALSAARRTANNIENVAPGKSNDVGFFALPGPDAASNGMTVWPGTAAMYIPKTVEGDKLDAAKKFIAFAATQQGCDAYSKGRRRRARTSQGLQAARRRLAGRQGHHGLLRLRQGEPGAGVHLADQGPGPGADLYPGRHRPGGRQEGRSSLRRGRQEAGAAAGPARLGVSGSHPGC